MAASTALARRLLDQDFRLNLKSQREDHVDEAPVCRGQNPRSRSQSQIVGDSVSLALANGLAIGQ